MGILKDYDEGKMNALRSITYAETGTETPYVVKPFGATSNEITHRIDDTSRIAKMLISKPGFKFLAHEALLNQTNIQNKLEKDRTAVGSVIGQLGKTAVNIVKVAGSTLAQIPVNGTGTHFLRGFRTDTYLQPLNGNNRSQFAQFFGGGGVEGAPLALKGAIINGEAQSNFGDKEASDKFTVTRESEFQIDSETPNYLDTNNINRQTGGPIPGSTSISSSKADTSINPPSTKVQDFRKDGNTSYYSLDYGKNTINKETRIRLGNQGKVSRIRTTYSVSDEDTIDQINKLAIQDTKIDGTKASRDLIKFKFEIITPEESKFLYFRAFITQFDDSFQGSWNSTKYLGRAEDLYTYQGFSRNVNLGFIISAASRDEMKPLYQKMAYLASATAPTYTNINNFMRGTLVKLTVGDYIYEVPGILESVNYSWQKDYSWEIAMQNPEGSTDDDMQELPHTMNCGIAFKPIHNFVPRTGKVPFITNPTPLGNRKPFIPNAETL